MRERLTENEEAVLVELYSSEENCVGYKFIEGVNSMGRKDLEPIIKHLKELGYINYWRGLMNEDGEVGGSGWCRSHKGNEYVEEHKL